MFWFISEVKLLKTAISFVFQLATCIAEHMLPSTTQYNIALELMYNTSESQGQVKL